MISAAFDISLGVKGQRGCDTADALPDTTGGAEDSAVMVLNEARKPGRPIVTTGKHLESWASIVARIRRNIQTGNNRQSI